MNQNLTAEEIKKIFQKLHRLEKNDELEVEDLLKLLKKPCVSLADPLREMAKMYDWLPINQERIVPFATWAEVVAIYFEKGIAEIIALAKKKDEISPFALSTLDYLPSVEAFEAFLAISECFEADLMNENREFIKKYAYNLCIASHSLKKMPISEELSDKIKEILKKIIVYTENIGDEPIKMLALVPFRYIGDLSDIDFVQKITFTEDCYQGYEKQFVREIKKRVK